MNPKILIIAAALLGAAGSLRAQAPTPVGDLNMRGGLTNLLSAQRGVSHLGVSQAAPGLVPLYIRLPRPPNRDAFINFETNDHLALPSGKPRPPLMVPPGTTNLAFRRTVRSSDLSPYDGIPDQLTVGAAAHKDRDSVLALHHGVQWVQVDLGNRYPLYAVVVWHSISFPKVVHGVVVQVADDAQFTQNVRTVFNNDYKNVTGLGPGKDKEYYESYEGKLIPVEGAIARYVRLYSAGSTQDGENTYLAVEVYGLAVEPR